MSEIFSEESEIKYRLWSIQNGPQAIRHNYFFKEDKRQ